MQCRSTIQHDRMLLDHILQHVPDCLLHMLDHALGALDVVGVSLLYQFLHDEGLEQFQCHSLWQAALIEFQFRSDNDYGTARVIDTFTK